MMTREDFTLIADALKDAHSMDAIALEDVATVAALLSDVFADRNPRFDRDRFLEAVGVADL